MKVIKKFEINRLEVMNEKGIVNKKLMPKLSKEDIKKIYEAIILTRVFDKKAIALQRQGRLGTYASMLGQEASIIGSAYALKSSDWIIPSFRESGIFLLRNYPIDSFFQFWAGDENGMGFTKDINMLPIAIPVGTQLLHAVGMAFASKFKNQNDVFMAFFSDGATSTGDFHEALNLASVYKLPVIFICQNNQYAISTPVKKQTGSETIAQKAIAYGIQGIQVDGNDVFAVYSAVKYASEKARKNNPILVECLTYRINDHTTSDDSKKYRDEKEVSLWKLKDPLERLRKYMEKNKMLSKEYEKSVLEASDKIIEEAVIKAESKNVNPEEMFSYIFDELTPNLKSQLNEFRQLQR